jgi:hypothetical protein
VFNGDFWRDFLTSAGFGGTLAFFAAVLATIGAVATLRHNKRVARHDRWWDTLTWVYDRTVTPKGDRPLAPTVTLSMMRALLSEVPSAKWRRRRDQLRSETISSLLEAFATLETVSSDVAFGPTSAPAPDNSRSESTSQSSYEEKLRRDLRNELAEHGVATGPNARAREAMVFEASVGAVVASAISQIDEVSLDADSDRRRFDGVLTTRRGRLAIEVKYLTQRSLRKPDVQHWVPRIVERMNSDERDYLGTLLIVNQDASDELRDLARHLSNGRVHLVAWPSAGGVSEMRELIRAVVQTSTPIEKVS